MRITVNILILMICALGGSISTKLWSQKYDQVVQLRGLKPIPMNASATAIAMKEVDGLLVLANLVQVELYLDNRIIAQYDYQDLLGVSGVARYDELYIEADTADSRIYIIHPQYGIGEICYACHVEPNANFATHLVKPKDNNPWDKKDALLGKQPFWDKLKEGQSKEEIDSLCRAYNQEVWVASEDDACIYIRNQALRQCIDVGTPLRDIAKSGYLSKQTGHHVFIAATKDTGLVKIAVSLEGELLGITPLHYVLPNGDRLANVRSVHYMEQYEAMLIGSVGTGVFLWSHLRNSVFTPLRASELVNSALARNNKYNHIWTIHPLSDGAVLTGNDIGTIDWVDMKSHTARTVFQADKSFQVMHIVSNKGSVFAAMRTENGDNRLYRLKWKNDSLHQEGMISFREQDNGLVHVLHAEGDTLWIGTSQGLYSIKTDSPQEMIPLPGKGNDNDAVRFIIPATFGDGDAQGFFYGGGPMDDKVYFRTQAGSEGTLTIDANNVKDISYIIPLDSNEYIISTRGNGFFLCKLQSNTNTLQVEKHFDPKKELIAYTNGGVAPILTVYGGVKYRKETVWLSTNFGLLEFDRKKGVFYRYDHEATGLPQSECNTLAFTQLNDSLAIFATLDGMVQVNMAAAIRIRERKAKIGRKPQIWRMVPMDSGKDTTNKVSNVQYQYEKIGTEGIRELYESQTGYFLVKPDYFLLNKELLSIIHHGGDTSFIYSGLVVSFSDIVGKKRWLATWLLPLPVNFEVYDAEFDANQNPNGIYLPMIGLILAIIGLIIVGLLLRWARNKSRKAKKAAENEKKAAEKARQASTEAEAAKHSLEQQRQQFEQRQKLFKELGEELEQADGFQDIQEAFLTISQEEMKTVLNATKISLYQYQPKQNTLQLIAHQDANPLAGEDNSDYLNFKDVNFDLNNPDDADYPVVHAWSKKKDIVANQAWYDFYESVAGLKRGDGRPTPKRGGKAESFIFLVVGAKSAYGHPFGVIAIQNEVKDAYQNESEVEQYKFLMNTIGRLAYFKVEEIDEKLHKQSLESRNRLYRNRLEAHFFGGIMDAPLSILERNNETISDASHEAIMSVSEKSERFFKSIYEINQYCTLKQEMELCETYLSLKKSTNLDVEPLFSFVLDEKVKHHSIPSLMLLNIVHNAYKYSKLSVDIKGEAKIINDNVLQVSISDKAGGFSPEAKARIANFVENGIIEGRESSLFTIITQLKVLEKVFGGQASLSIEDVSTNGLKGSKVILRFSDDLLNRYDDFITKL